MSTPREWVARLRGTFAGRGADAELAEELDAHLEMDIADQVGRGVSPAEARRRALIRAGGLESAKEAYRDQRGLPLLDTLQRDVRYAFRGLVRHPGFTAAAVLALGVGIGATTTIYSVVRTVLLAPLPYDRAEELVWVENRYLPDGDRGGISSAEFAEYRQGAGAFEGLSAVALTGGTLTGIDRPLRLDGMVVSRSYFDLLRVPFDIGRSFTAEEEGPGGSPAVIVSRDLWVTALGSDPDIVGRSIEIDGVSRVVVGVVAGEHAPLAPLLFPGRSADFYTPAVIDPGTFDTSTVEVHSMRVVGRLAPGVEVDAAERALLPAVARLEERFPDISSAGARDVAVTPLSRVVSGDVGPTLWIVLGAGTLLLLVACGNVANMFLARSEERAMEWAVHAALGAGRARLVLFSLTESVLVGLGGGVLGVGIVVGLQRVLMLLAPPSFPRVGDVGLDVRLLVFCTLVSLSAGILAGALPSLRFATVNPVRHLRASGTAPFAGGRTFLRRALVIGQLAGAVVVAVGAALLGRTVMELRSVELGFEPSNLVTFEVGASRAIYRSQDTIRGLYVALLERLEALPGTEVAAASWQTPLQAGMSDWPVRPNVDGAEWVSADPNMVTNGYFQTFGIELVEGRLFDDSDLARPEGAVILGETAARALFPNGSAVGQLVNVNFDSQLGREVVGVVKDVRFRELGGDPRPQTYFTLSDLPFGPNSILKVTVRTGRSADEVEAAAAAIMAKLDPDVPIGQAIEMDEQIGASMAGERFLATLLGGFAGTALLIGTLGVYGLLAYDVSRRRRELGLRIALGASQIMVLKSVVRVALLVGACGVVIGVAGAVATSRLLEGFLYGVSSTDPTTMAAVGALALAIAIIASIVPARSATSVDPIIALRDG